MGDNETEGKTENEEKNSFNPSASYTYIISMFSCCSIFWSQSYGGSASQGSTKSGHSANYDHE
jgi:hypothetical protein